MLQNLSPPGDSPALRQPVNPVDDALILSVAQGDSEAFAALYEQTKSAVYGFALSILRDPHSAEDVMQDTYIHIHKNAYWYRPQGKPMAWILTIVRNLAYTRLREKKKQENPENVEWVAAYEPDREQDSLNGMLLDTALRILPEEERQIVILFSVSGMKHREIASLLQLPLATELSKYRRSIQKLKDFLEKEGEARA